MAAPAFEATFAVPMTCQSCIDDISASINQLDGVIGIKADLDSQTVCVTGSEAPSAVVGAIQKTGRDAIVRGSGRPDGAAVCILETHAVPSEEAVRGLVRMVEVGDNQTLIDLTLNGLEPGTYEASLHTLGNITEGPESAGSVWGKESHDTTPRGAFGVVEVDQNKQASVVLDKAFAVWEVIGRSVVVSPVGRLALKGDQNSVVGVVARSAGVWENDKTVCACSGQTLWEERDGCVRKGLL